MVVSSLMVNHAINLKATADDVVRALAYARGSDTDAVITLPIMFPSGRAVTIKLLGGPLKFTVTDDGATMREADLMGAADICRREARKVADETGVRFNDWELFEAECEMDRLAGMTAIVANAASTTLMRTADKFAERFAMRRREELSVRLGRIFGERAVAKNVEVPGASNKLWNFDARVALPSGRSGLFTVVTPSQTSIAFAYSKIDDLSRATPRPYLAAVLDGKLAADDKALLSRAANRLFLVDQPDDDFRIAA